MAQAIIPSFVKGVGIEMFASSITQDTSFLFSEARNISVLPGSAPIGVIREGLPRNSTTVIKVFQPDVTRSLGSLTATFSNKIEVFYSYSHKDEEMRRELDLH